jgi:hypothetical protein
MATIKKAQAGIKQDSVKTKNDSILVKKRKINLDALNKISDDFAKKKLENRAEKLKMKNGGSLSGLKASNKRVGPVDPKGAYTKVQKKTLTGAKGKASLTKDKQLGATKMAKCGTKMSNK